MKIKLIGRITACEEVYAWMGAGHRLYTLEKRKGR